MNRFQKINFSSVGEFLDYLPAEQLSITELLRQTVLECSPHLKEKLSYNVPFYSYYTRICFIWPGAVPWGGTKSGVQFGLCKGYLLSNALNYFDKGNRKEVLIKTFSNLSEVDPAVLKAFIWAAIELDSQLHKKT
jgi:hypothetical protein